jgi:hypothetical protein
VTNAQLPLPSQSWQVAQAPSAPCGRLAQASPHAFGAWQPPQLTGVQPEPTQQSIVPPQPSGMLAPHVTPGVLHVFGPVHGVAQGSPSCRHVFVVWSQLSTVLAQRSLQL